MCNDKWFNCSTCNAKAGDGTGKQVSYGSIHVQAKIIKTEREREETIQHSKRERKKNRRRNQKKKKIKKFKEIFSLRILNISKYNNNQQPSTTTKAKTKNKKKSTFRPFVFNLKAIQHNSVQHAFLFFSWHFSFFLLPVPYTRIYHNLIGLPITPPYRLVWLYFFFIFFFFLGVHIIKYLIILE